MSCALRAVTCMTNENVVSSTMFTCGGQAQTKANARKNTEQGGSFSVFHILYNMILSSPQMIPAQMKMSLTVCWSQEDVPLPSQSLLYHQASQSLRKAVSAAVLMVHLCSPTPPRPPCPRYHVGAHPDEILHQKTTHRFPMDLCDCPTLTGTVLLRFYPCQHAQTLATFLEGKTPTIQRNNSLSPNLLRNVKLLLGTGAGHNDSL